MSDRRPYGRQEREEYGGRGASDYDERHGFNRSNGPREQRLSFATPMSMNDPEAAFNSRNGYSTGERSQRKTTPNSLTQSSGGPVRKTPNSLVQSTGGPTSRAERKGDMYGQSSRQKTPDSLMDSIGPTSRADIKEEPYYSGRGNDLRTAQQRSRSIDRFDARSGSSSQGRHTKSYVERYQDIKQMTLNGGDEYETHRKSHQQRSKSADRWSASARDDPLGRSGAPRGSRPGNGIRAASPALASRNYRNHNYASSSQRGAEDIERTPLERWESRKERKQAESSLSRESPPYSARTDQTATPSSRDATLASDMSIRANRWSPQSNSDEYGRNERGYSPEHRPKPARNRDPYGRQGYGESGDSSPLFNDVDEEGAGNINVGQRSPLSINNRFDRNYDDDVASTTRSVMSGNSTYADNLKSFSESITGPLAEGKSIRRENYEPSHQHHESREPHSHDRSGDRGGMPTDSFERNTPNHHDLNDEDASYQEKRVRWGASDFCKRFTENRKDQPRSSSSSQNWGVWKPPQEHDTAYDHGNPVRQSLDKSKKMYMWLALTVCAVCIVAVAATVTYFQGESNRENSVAASTITPPPTMSSMPSEAPTMTPSSSPSNNPTPRPSTERERLIGEFLHSVSEGESSKVGTPQYEAKMWLLFDDDLFLHLPGHDTASWESNIAERIKQRFALVTMYFAMGIGEGGVSKGWLDGDECRNVGDYGRAWDGVACNGDGVVRAVALGKK